MTLRNFSLLIALGTLLAWGAWAIILLNVDPREAGIPGFIMFYLTLGAGLTGTVALALSFLRIIVLRRKSVPSREINVSFRHAVLFAVVTVGSLILSSQGWMRTWHVVALIAIVTLIEAFFLQTRRR